MQHLVVPGRPVPKARHKIRLYGGRVLAYTPAKTQEYERAVRLCAMEQRLRKERGEVAVVAVFHTSGPGDLDNLLKSLLDGLNGRAWKDDRQVKAILAVKRPCRRGQERTEAVILPVGEFAGKVGPLVEALMGEAGAKPMGGVVV